MNAINLGNGGTYCNGQTWYAFRPYRGADVRGYKKVERLGNLHNVWARIDDRGDTTEDRDYEGQLVHVTPRYSINVPGWGSQTVSSELIIFRPDADAAEWDRLFAFLSN